MKRLALLTLVTLSLVGCNQKGGQHAARTSFEQFVPRFLAALDQVYEEEWNASPANQRFAKPEKLIMRETLYDVRTTDSLVHPYEASITYTYTVFGGPYGHFEMTSVARFGYEEGKWVPTTWFFPKDGTSGRIARNVKGDYGTIWIAYQKVTQ
jgi:hypothetical protein